MTVNLGFNLLYTMEAVYRGADEDACTKCGSNPKEDILAKYRRLLANVPQVLQMIQSVNISYFRCYEHDYGNNEDLENTRNDVLCDPGLFVCSIYI